jgi:hypothetical protein
MFKNKRTPTYYNIMEGMVPGSGAAVPAGVVPPPAVVPVPATGGVAPMATSDVVNQLSNAMAAMNAGPVAPSVSPTTSTTDVPMPGVPVTASKTAFTKKKSEAMTQLTPATYNGSSGDSALSGMFQGMASGAANQKNQAYNTMNSLGGGANTGDLLGQQTEMINNLKTIEPILQTAEKFLDKFEKIRQQQQTSKHY